MSPLKMANVEITHVIFLHFNIISFVCDVSISRYEGWRDTYNFAGATAILTTELFARNIFRWNFSSPRKHPNGITLNIGFRSFGIWISYRCLDCGFGRCNAWSNIANRVYSQISSNAISSFRIEKGHIVTDCIAVEIFTLRSYRKNRSYSRP